MQLYQQPSVLNAAARWVCDSRKYDHISPRSALAESMVGMVNVNLYRAIPKSQAASSFALPSLSSGLAVTPQPCTYNQGLHWTANRDTRSDFGGHPTSWCCPVQNYRPCLRRCGGPHLERSSANRYQRIVHLCLQETLQKLSV